MQLQVTQYAGQQASTLQVSDAIFAAEFKEDLVHQVITAYMAKGRAGTKAQKTRSEVRGGGAKPWRQKGTGRARAGSIRSPIWRTGGVTFAAKPRDYSKKVNKRMYRGAFNAILSELVRQERLLLVNDLTIAEAKTKAFIDQLKELGLEGRTLIVIDEMNKNLLLSARNVPDISIAYASEVDPVSLVAADNVLMTVSAVKKIEERLA